MKGEEGNYLAPGPTPALADRRIFFAPFRGLESRKRRFARRGVVGAIDGFQRRSHGLAILVGDEVEAVAQQMHDAGLDLRLGEDGKDRFRKALQTVDDGDENILDATVFQLVHDAQPEFGAFVLFEPEAENLLGSVGADAQSDVNGLVADEPLVADFDAQRVEEDDRINGFERTPLPRGDLVENGVGDGADQIGRNLHAVKIAQMSGDLPHAHAARIHGDDFLVEARETALIFGDELRIEARLPIARNLQLDPARVGRHGLFAIAVAAVAGLAGRQMMIHLGVQRPLGQRLLQLVEQTIGIKRCFRIRAGQKLVE